MTSDREAFAGKVAVVTGAGSGIGRALALGLTERGARLALSDIDAAGLAETVRLVEAAGGDVHAQALDVSEREAVLEYAEAVADHFGVIHQIYNNAGIAHHGEVETTSFKDYDRVMDVDFWGVVHGTKAFLPHLIASGDGHVVNISSLFGLLSMPGQSAYNAAKFAVRGFTESLREEMLVDSRPVRVTCVHPGGIKTAIARNASVSGAHDQQAIAEEFDKQLARMTPEKAATIILDGVRKNRPRVLVGADAVALDVIVRVIGPAYQRVVAAIAKRTVP